MACPQCRRPFRPAEARVNTTLVDMMRRLPQLRELVRFGDALLDVDPAQAVHMPVFVFEDHHSPAFRQLVQLMAAHAVFESREFWNPDTVAAAVGGAVGAGSAAWGGVKLLKAAKAGKMAAGAGKALLLPKVALGLGVVGAVLGGGYLLYQLHGQRQERNKRNKIEQELRAAYALITFSVDSLTGIDAKLCTGSTRPRGSARWRSSNSVRSWSRRRSTLPLP